MAYLNHTPLAGGAELRFAHLTPYDVFGNPAEPGTNGIVPKERKRQKAALVENFEEWIRPELPEEDRLREKLRLLREFDREPFSRTETFLDWIKRPESDAQNVLLRLCWGKANPNDKMPDLSAEDADAVFWALLGPFGIGRAEDASPAAQGVKPVDTSTYGDGGAPANPPLPLTYSTTLPPTAVTEPGTVSGTPDAPTVTGSPTGA